MPDLISAPCQECSVERAIEIVGGKWKLLLIRTLITDGPQRFNQLLQSVAAISPKVLTQNLRDLESRGILVRDDSESRLYRLTESGMALMPALHLLGEWSDEHVAREGVLPGT